MKWRIMNVMSTNDDVSSHARHAIKTSEESAALNRGPEVIASYGLTWIITSYHITVTRLPRVGEQIQVATQARIHKFFCYRYFWLLAEDGTEPVKSRRFLR